MWTQFIKTSCLTATATAALITTSTANAAETVAGDQNPGGINYRFSHKAGEGLTIGESFDIVSVTGSCTFRDPALATAPILGVDLTHGSTADGLIAVPPDNRGWVHQSKWVSLRLMSDAILTITLQREAGVTYTPPGELDPVIAGDSLVPAFALFSGWDNDKTPFPDIHFNFPPPPELANNWHVYNNAGNIAWAEDLNFIANAESTGQALADGTIPTDGGLITQDYLLSAGEYSIVLSGFVGEFGTVQNEGFRATFSAADVPEPASFALLTCGAALAFRRPRPKTR